MTDKNERLADYQFSEAEAIAYGESEKWKEMDLAERALLCLPQDDLVARLKELANAHGMMFDDYALVHEAAARITALETALREARDLVDAERQWKPSPHGASHDPQR